MARSGSRLLYTHTNANGVVTGDFNGDSKPDFASAGSDGTVGIWLNKGDGTFLPRCFSGGSGAAQYDSRGFQQ